jgi:23S rRNA pseudouridine1911/1915/1917 synthase
MAPVETGASATRVFRVDAALSGRRLDQVLAQLLPQFSRSRLQQWIDQGHVLLDGAPCRRRDTVWGGEEVRVEAHLPTRGECGPQPIPLRVLFEDEDILVVDKPAGMVVHPAAGNPDGTLQNALLHHDPALDRLPRGGIVHRLDKDTSGLLVVAKRPSAHKSLIEQLQARAVHREYRALVRGVPVAGGRVDAPIGRDPLHRTRMAVVPSGRPAVTRFEVVERFLGVSLLGVRLETGRTHQIRVHLAHLRYPLVGDRTYGGAAKPPKGVSPDLSEALQRFPRQALHALRLGLRHPRTGSGMHWEAPMPADLRALLSLLRSEHAFGLD